MTLTQNNNPTVETLLAEEEKVQGGKLQGLSLVRGTGSDGKYADVAEIIGFVFESVSVVWTRHRDNPVDHLPGSISMRSFGWTLLRER
jgi:hypothetical protein